MTTSATMLRLFVDALDRLGVDWLALLRECAVDPDTLSDPEARFSEDRFERVWVTAEKVTGDRCVGLHAGECVHAHAVNLFGYLMLSSATIGVGIERVARYQRVLTQVPWLEVEEESDGARLRVGARTGGETFRAIHAEYVAGLVLKVMGWVSEVEVVPHAVKFQHAARGPLPEYLRVLRCNVEFGADQSEVVLDAATTSRPSNHAEEALARVHVELAERLLSSWSETEVTDRVRRLLAENLESDKLDLSSVARELGMSARSLQRRLSDEGANFRGLLDGLRREVAREHLEHCRTPIAGVAHLAGFSDVSAFTRAVNRWFGETPARLREHASRRRS